MEFENWVTCDSVTGKKFFAYSELHENAQNSIKTGKLDVLNNKIANREMLVSIVKDIGMLS